MESREQHNCMLIIMEVSDAGSSSQDAGKDITHAGLNIIKKRSAIGNARKRKIEEEEDGEGEAEATAIEQSRLKSIREQQESRVRKNGISIHELKQSDKAQGSKVEKTVGGLLGNQFSVTVDHGLGVNVAHEKVMEQYIETKLGLKQNAPQPTKVRTMDDEIYSIPQELKVTNESSDSVAGEEEVVARWSTGIAEVALPSSFREKTYAETEAMAKKRREIEELESLVRKNATSSGFARFHVEDPTFSVIPVELLAPKIAESASQPNNRANRPERASDFQAFGEFKKRLNKLRR